MLSLEPYGRRPARLEDYLPWGFLVAPGVILNKDGSFLAAARFRGPDVASATPEELMSLAARANAIFRRLGSGAVLYVEAERRPIHDYPAGAFPDPASRLVDAERAAAFEAAAEAGAVHFETVQTLTLQWSPPADSVRRAARFFFALDGEAQTTAPGATSRTVRPKAPWPFGRLRATSQDATTIAPGVADAATAAAGDERASAREALADFQRLADWAFGLFAPLASQFERLDDGGLLTYLKSTISPRAQTVAPPATPAFLDGLLCDADLVGGTHPRLGAAHLRVLTVKGFPALTAPGILDDLNALAAPFRFVTRFIAMDRTEAERELTKWRRLWFSKHKSMAALLKEVVMKEGATFADPDALAKTAEVEGALADLGAEAVGFGYLTTTVTVLGATAREADDRLRVIERTFAARGFVTVAETLNAVEAWLSSIPGQAYANVRQPIVSTLNFAHVAPLATPWSGPEWNAHLNAPPLALARTQRATPFRLDLHVGDVGHTLILGPTGAGKSVLLAFLALQWRRYAGAQVFVFDKGGSARAAVRAMGGTALDLGASGVPAFQPLADIDDPAERALALDWVLGLLAQENVPLDPAARDRVWTALSSLATAPKAQRHLTGLRLLVQDPQLQQALSPYTQEGAYGSIFDGVEDRLRLNDVALFEMEEILTRPRAAAPALLHLFARLERRFDGRPTLLILDEAWLFLDTPLFAARIRDWLKTLRKKNVAVVFATQSLADVAASSIAPALIDSCPTRIYLPNERAFEPQQRRAYEAFGLNATEIGLLATAQRKRDYYYASPKGRRLFELALGPIALAFAAASDPDARALVAQLERDGVPDHAFWAAFLKARGLSWVVDAVGAPAPARPPPSSTHLPATSEPKAPAVHAASPTFQEALP